MLNEKKADKKMAQYLYRHFNKENELLYIGVSLNHFARLAQHKEASQWFHEIAKVTIEVFNDRKAVLAAETAAIINEKPKYNIRKRGIPEPDKKTPFEQSAIELIRQVATFHPVYRINDAERLLEIGHKKLMDLIDSCEIGHIKIPRTPRRTAQGKEARPYTIAITGWQIIEFLENLTKKSEAA